MKKPLIAAGIFALTLAPVASAEQTSAVAFSAGAFAVFDTDTAAEIGAEYRFAPLESVFNLIPAVGINANSDGGYWAHAGFRYDIELNPNWILTPNVAVVGYENGGGRDLGHGLQFRTGLELAYQLNTSSRIGLGIYHMSNAHLGKNNPGAESIFLSYSFTPDF
ncbi:acyloxyacyl hydrolase [Methylophaga sp. OBS4]|uniref:acyloxyacyl hydrolase n=1 Tax=Methylophaga sp. OBS4 TaxID=2991935 RepID=UPI00225016FC|nr:acyloxyacyl hydrolase [Methylophaga sp. OBS4]MCX4188344.1 acyloxyacyl hydrolase [Methylophaga sp. OBS4]